MIAEVMSYIILGLVISAGAIFALTIYNKEVLWSKRIDLWKMRRGVLVREDESATVVTKRGTEKEIKELKLKKEKRRMPIPEDLEWGLKKGSFNRYHEHLIIYSPYPDDYRVIRAQQDLEKIEFTPLKTNMKLFYIQDLKQNRLLTKRQTIGEIINKVLHIAAPLVLGIALVIVWKQGAEFATQATALLQGVADTLLKSTETLANIQQLVPKPPA